MMTVTGLNETLQRLTEASEGQDDNSEKIRLVLMRLADIGIAKANLIYSRSTSSDRIPVLSYTFTDDYTVCVKADGTDVLFLEFGTGITYMQDYPTDEGFEPIFTAGSWSDNESLGGKHHWNSPYGWWYIKDGNKYHSYGNPPIRAMYEAKKEMKNQIENVMREVFG